MQDLEVNKAQLIEKLKANRDAHKDIVAAAQVRFRERAIEELDKRLADAKDGRDINLVISLPIPTDYTQEYDNAIAQLEWERKDWIILDPADFNTLVLNQWRWAAQFAGTSIAYAEGKI